MKKQENIVGLKNINFSFFHKVRQFSSHANVGPFFVCRNQLATHENRIKKQYPGQMGYK
jgi:hypothetical protein